MDALSLTALADEQIAAARASSAGRSARTIHGGHTHALRQTVLALLAGQALGEHESPGEATLQVLVGRVRLSATPRLIANMASACCSRRSAKPYR